ncbi:hypothetical protein CYY_001874 [Polysphondylium violaceum]|uniref:NAD-dependent epimerase/dehydratase domain-containing protein n=1 Tax=Polysphondylium violaceum TaxID=133409 RepID=A0A8J4UVS5_9MYCE|nr:hypothetical protein CYY_001874 [Polysphondylium violaceum]
MQEINEKVLITGGQGFIGSWIAKLLLNENKYEVIILDMKQDHHILEQIMSIDMINKIKFVYSDICNFDHVNQIILENKPSFIIHLAALQIPGCKQNPIVGANVNVIGTLNVFEAAKNLLEKQGKSTNIIYASSAAVCGPSEDYEGVVKDNVGHNPMTFYGVYKQANEGSARVYWSDYKIPSVGLRPFTVYGVGREIGVTSAPTKLLKSCLFARDYNIPFSGKLCVNYVEDIANLFISLGKLKDLQGSHVCNIQGDEITVEEWIAIVKKVLPDQSKSIKISNSGNQLPFPTSFDQDLLDKLLGTKVKTTSPEQGIKSTLEIFESLYDKQLLKSNDL